MDKTILNTQNQEFINKNLNSDIPSLLLKGIPFNNLLSKLIIKQIEAKKKCQKKLPTWFNTAQIYYPDKLNIEQTSSEITAQYKSTLISGASLIDLTGGFGVDSYYFSKCMQQVTHCELNNALSNIVKHNYKQLKTNNITCKPLNGIEALKQISKNFDWIYIDPSRRDDIKGKVFLLNDCLPNVPKFLNLFFKYSKNIMIKTAPLLDISSGISELKSVSCIHVVAIENEVKELLWVLEKEYSGTIKIKTVNIKRNEKIHFNFLLNEEKEVNPNFSPPLSYLYEPNASILKAGAFNTISKKLNVYKLHKHSHLYTSESFINFPGRSFMIESVIPYNKKEFKNKLKINKANVATRNFPETVQQIRKKLSIKDGGDNYLFFTTDINDNKIIILSKKN